MVKMVSLRLAVSALIWMSLLTSGIQAQQQPPDGWVTVNVRYGYFSETRPMLAACARGWFDLAHEPTRTYYKVGCYPQSSGNFVSSRLDNLELDIAHIGSTPWAQAVARGVDAVQIYTSHYMGESQGIYVRPNEAALDYTGIVTPYDLRGRTVGVPFGSTTHYQLLFLIELLNLKGTVKVLNMSPREIMDAWDAAEIDAGAVWGTARDYILEGGEGAKRPASTLLSSGVISDWGRSTYVVVAATRTFATQHADFVRHFVGVASRVVDSFIDFLGEKDPQNVHRWVPELVRSSLIPSMVDALMLEDQSPGSPDLDVVFSRRMSLDLFEDNDAVAQASCQLMGSGPGTCTSPTTQHWTLRETAAFLIDQKVLAGLGTMEDIGDDGCRDVATFCGGDIIDGSYLKQSRSDCDACLPVGPYANSTPPVSSASGNPDLLLSTLEDLDDTSGRSSYASFEIGRVFGDSTSCAGNQQNWIGNDGPITGFFGDGANGEDGKSYSDELLCGWEIRGVDCEDPSDACKSVVEVSFTDLRLWSGDKVRIYADSEFNCTANSTTSYVIAEASGFGQPPPSVNARGCIRVVFDTDANEEHFYGTNDGDGFRVEYNRDGGCLSDADCGNSFACDDGFCKCDGQNFGADCLSFGQCFGTSRVVVLTEGQPKTAASSDVSILRSELQKDLNQLGDVRSLNPSETYPNDAFCSFEIEVPTGFRFVKVEILYDLEPTYDVVSLFKGAGNSLVPVVVLTGTHRSSGSPEAYYVPVDDKGLATLRFETDARGRRRGFVANLRAVREDPGSFLGGDRPCPLAGQSGYNCEVPHCINQNRLIAPLQSQPSPWNLGRVVSQTEGLTVPAMPWAPEGGCSWTLTPQGIPPVTDEAVALRLVFHRPLGLEAFPATAVGDKLVVRQKRGSQQIDEELFVESCENNEACSFEWQTGECNDNGGCDVRTSVEIPFFFDEFDEFTEPFVTSLHLITDRNDQLEMYRGVDFDALLVQQCEVETCQDAGGTCLDGFCYCNDIACSCSCDDVADVISSGVKIGVVLGVLAPVFACLFVGFYIYRRRKIKQSREQKKIIEEKDAELEQFRNSVVGMRAAIADYTPKAPKDLKETARPTPKVQWCWKETDFCMANHDEDAIFGPASDCWIKYGNSDEVERAYQKYQKKKKQEKATFSPLPGYILDFSTMIQTKQATGFQREVKRFVEKIEEVDLDLKNVEVGDGLPEDLLGEPQMILVKGDIIQISKQRDDGWAFGSKMHHQNEALARQLLRIAVGGEDSTLDDTAILTDTGWFPLDQTDVPSGDDLAVLQSQVGDTGELAAPRSWDPVVDPTSVELHDLREGDSERDAVVTSFLSTLNPPQFRKVKIVRVQRVQNLAMWQSYVVKRQTICYREHFDPSSGPGSDAYKKALQRFERNWLWHGTNVEVMDKILQQGFNRSFCGKNATAYGKGVYFARDASYSAYRIYAVPDNNGVQYMMACRVVVGEYCPGKMDGLTPDLRDASKNMLYDSTVGLLGSDTMASPSIYVTYHDAQAYPEYLIAFKSSS